MKRVWIYILLMRLAGAPMAEAGTIVGKVHAEGKPGTEADPNCAAGNYDSRALKFAQRIDYAAMHDFVVYLEGVIGTNPPVVPDKPVEVVTKKERVSQHKAVFVPHILPVVKGTTVEWPNDDEIFHNVFSFSETKSFDLGLYKGREGKPVTFDTPGRVDVFCSIHSSMNCVVLVLENPFFATTNEKGNYVISNVPPGTYQLKAWHERLPSQRRKIIVPENGEVRADFTLGITGLPKL
jgi:plastocyanin